MHGQVRTTAFQFGVTATTLARSIVVIVLVIVVSIDNVIYFRVRVPSKILGSTRIFFPIMANVALDDVVYVGGAVLVELDMMARAFLKDDNSDVDRAQNTELICLFEQAILAL